MCPFMSQCTCLWATAARSDYTMLNKLCVYLCSMCLLRDKDKVSRVRCHTKMTIILLCLSLKKKLVTWNWLYNNEDRSNHNTTSFKSDLGNCISPRRSVCNKLLLHIKFNFDQLQYVFCNVYHCLVKKQLLVVACLKTFALGVYNSLGN